MPVAEWRLVLPWLHPRCWIQHCWLQGLSLPPLSPLETTREGPGSRPQEETLCSWSKEATCRGSGPPILGIWVGRGSVDTFRWITGTQDLGLPLPPLLVLRDRDEVGPPWPTCPFVSGVPGPAPQCSGSSQRILTIIMQEGRLAASTEASAWSPAWSQLPRSRQINSW